MKPASMMPSQEASQCGKLIKKRRKKIALTKEELAKQLEIPLSEIISIESGQSPLETYAPVLLHFAELVDQPIFNLSYPCGLPHNKISDYT
jgi:DNA-binding XRE family transcriptional regulator